MHNLFSVVKVQLNFQMNAQYDLVRAFLEPDDLSLAVSLLKSII